MATAQPVKALASFIENQNQQESLEHFASGYVGKGKIAFLNAQYLPGTVFDLPEFRENIVSEQSFRPLYLELKNAGMNVSSQLSLDINDGQNLKEYEFTHCLILAGKYRVLNENMINRAHSLTRAGGSIIVAGAKNTGIISLRKRAANNSKIIDSASRFHSVVFQLESVGRAGKSNSTPEQKVKSDNHTYATKAGLFSSDAPDSGSVLLAGHFNNKIQGTVADLGAGWGYLSAELLSRSDKITDMDLYEADWNGLNLARQNLEDVSKSVETRFKWHDVISEAISTRYNWVIMNPPFHTGRDTSTELGQYFIQKASLILKPRGNLLMVANQHLAYEATIRQYFSSFRILETKSGFKIITAQI